MGRGGSVLWAAADLPLAPGQVVVIALSEGEALATVVVAPAQLLEQEGAIAPSAKVLRSATEQDILILGRRPAEAPEPAASAGAFIERLFKGRR